MSAEKRFTPYMAVADAIKMHPLAGEVFAAFHLGGCAHSQINTIAPIEQVCAAYGIEVNVLLKVLEGLFESEPAPNN